MIKLRESVMIQFCSAMHVVMQLNTFTQRRKIVARRTA